MPDGILKVTNVTNLRKESDIYRVWYSNDMFRFQADFVTLVTLKSRRVAVVSTSLRL